MVEPVGGAGGEQVAGERDQVGGVVEGHDDVALGTIVQREVGERVLSVPPHGGEGVAAVQRVGHLADGIVARGHLYLVAVAEGRAQQHDAVGARRVRLVLIGGSGAMQIRDTAPVRAPLPVARAAARPAAPALPQLVLLEGRQHVAALRVQHLRHAREAGVAGDEGEGPLDAGCDQVASVGAERDRFVHPGVPDGAGRPAGRQLDDLAARVVLEQVGVVVALEQEGHRARRRGGRARVPDGGPGGEDGRGRLRAAVRRLRQGDDRARGRPLQHPGRRRSLPARRGGQGGDHARVARHGDAAVPGRRDPDLGPFLQVRQEGQARAVGRPHQVAHVDPVGQLHIRERPLAQRIEAEPVEAVDVEVPGPVGGSPEFEHGQTQGFLPHLLQRRQLGRERNDEVVAVGADVVQGGEVRIGGEEVLDDLVGEDVSPVDVEGVAGILGDERRYQTDGRQNQTGHECRSR